MASRSASEESEGVGAAVARVYPPALALVVAMAVATGACTSPLGLETPRIDSILVPAMAMRSVYITLRSGDTLGRFDTTAIDPWLHVADTTHISVTQIDGTPRVSLRLRLTDSLRSSATIALRILDVDLPDIPVGDSVELDLQPGARNRITAQLAIARDTFAVNALTRNATAMSSLRYRKEHERRYLDGTIEVVIIRSAVRLRMIIEISAEQ